MIRHPLHPEPIDMKPSSRRVEDCRARMGIRQRSLKVTPEEDALLIEAMELTGMGLKEVCIAGVQALIKAQRAKRRSAA